LNDGSAVLLPGLKSSINNLKKLFKKKRDEINKQTKRRKYIFGSTSLTTYTNLNISTSSIPSSTQSQSTIDTSVQTPISIESSNNSSTNSQSSPSFNPLTDQIHRKVTTVITNWLNKNKEDLYLQNTDIQREIDFKLELNNHQDGLIMICGCGARNSIGQKGGTFMVRDICLIVTSR